MAALVASNLAAHSDLVTLDETDVNVNASVWVGCARGATAHQDGGRLAKNMVRTAIYVVVRRNILRKYDAWRFRRQFGKKRLF